MAASLAVAACGSGTGGSSAAAEPAAAGEDDRIECALDGANAFARDCTVERSTAEGQSLLVVRHPDGAFRRFAIVTDGRGVIAADGAQAVTAVDRHSPDVVLMDIRMPGVSGITATERIRARPHPRTSSC